jgi:hypothetical protein
MIDRWLYVFVNFQFDVNILHNELTTAIFDALKVFGTNETYNRALSSIHQEHYRRG